MTPREFAEARRRIGWPQERLADSLDVSVERLRAWESGHAPVPRRVARELAYRLAWVEYEEGVRAAGIPVCAWAEAWDATPFPEDDAGVRAAMGELRAHEEACHVCTARNRYAQLHPPPLPRRRPLPLVSAVLDGVERLPAPLRPVALGALAFGAVAIVGVLFGVLGSGISPGRLADGLRVLVAALVAGAAGGVAYLVARPLRTRAAGVGPYLLGLLCAGTCMGVALFLVQVMGGGPGLPPGRWIRFAVLAVVAGLAMGHGWFRPGPSPPPGP